MTDAKTRALVNFLRTEADYLVSDDAVSELIRRSARHHEAQAARIEALTRALCNAAPESPGCLYPDCDCDPDKLIKRTK